MSLNNFCVLIEGRDPSKATSYKLRPELTLEKILTTEIKWTESERRLGLNLRLQVLECLREKDFRDLFESFLKTKGADRLFTSIETFVKYLAGKNISIIPHFDEWEYIRVEPKEYLLGKYLPSRVFEIENVTSGMRRYNAHLPLDPSMTSDSRNLMEENKLDDFIVDSEGFMFTRNAYEHSPIPLRRLLPPSKREASEEDLTYCLNCPAYAIPFSDLVKSHYPEDLWREDFSPSLALFKGCVSCYETYLRSNNLEISSETADAYSGAQLKTHVLREVNDKKPPAVLLRYSANPLAYTKGYLIDEEKEYRLFDRNHVDATRYLGIEYEVTFPSDKIPFRGIIDSLDGYAICKFDRSVGDSSRGYFGVEVCTVPATFRIHKKKWKSFFQEYTDKTSVDKIPSGMHVHVSDLSMSRNTKNKLYYMLNRDTNADFVFLISERRREEFDRWCQSRYRKLDSATQRTGQEEKHRILRPKKVTHELRIFNAPKRYETFLKNLEFVESIIQFVEQASYNQLDYYNYLSWLTSEERHLVKYPNLGEFLIVAGLISGKGNVKVSKSTVEGMIKAEKIKYSSLIISKDTQLTLEQRLRNPDRFLPRSSEERRSQLEILVNVLLRVNRGMDALNLWAYWEANNFETGGDQSDIKTCKVRKITRMYGSPTITIGRVTEHDRLVVVFGRNGLKVLCSPTSLRDYIRFTDSTPRIVCGTIPSRDIPDGVRRFITTDYRKIPLPTNSVDMGAVNVPYLAQAV